MSQGQGRAWVQHTDPLGSCLRLGVQARAGRAGGRRRRRRSQAQGLAAEQPPRDPRSSLSRSPAANRQRCSRGPAVPPVKGLFAAEGPLFTSPGRTIRKINNVCAFPEREMKRRQRLAPRSRAPMSELPARPLHTHIPPLCDPWPAASGNRPGAGRRLPLRRSAHPRRRRRRGAGGGEAQGRGAGEEEAPGPRGRRQTPRARDSRGGRRRGAAAGRGALEARPAGGIPEAP